MTAKISKDNQDVCAQWQIYTNHKQKVTSMMDTGELTNPQLLKTTVSTWGTFTKGQNG